MRCSILILLLLHMLTSCRGADAVCANDDDCDRFVRAVCDEGACVCEFDELDRCRCDQQSRCDDIYGEGQRTCVGGSCVACIDDTDCGRLGRCSSQGECFVVECESNADCPIGFCVVERNDCVACQGTPDCPNGLVCREDGACVECVSDGGCGTGDVCDVDVLVRSDVEIVGTNQCGLDCSPRCREECSDDPDCVLRPACVVEDPDCLPPDCETWDSCELPEQCALRLGSCPGGVRCEALARSFVTPVHYACLPTPCLYDFECGDDALCYEGRCLPGCDDDDGCDATHTCVARAYFARGACLPL